MEARTAEVTQEDAGKQSEPAWLAALIGATAGLAVAAIQAVLIVAGATVKKEVPKPVWTPQIEVGVTEPLGYFDPLSFTKDEASFRKFRIAEIKHGRVAMMAAVGAVAQHYLKLPGFESVPSGLTAVTAYPGSVGFAVLFLLAGFMELVFWQDDISKEPGNFGDPAGWASTGLGPDGSYSDEMRVKELNNGRMAMVASMGIIFAELATGKDAMQQLGQF